MEVEVVEKTNERMVINWSGPTGFGQLVIKYNGKGGYEVDAEYIGMDTLIEILSQLK